MTSPDWVIVTAPTNRGADPAAELTLALTRLARRRPDVVFATAVLGGHSPTITETLDDASHAGARCILVLSGQTVPDRKMDAWFRRVIGHLLRSRPTESTSGRLTGLAYLGGHEDAPPSSRSLKSRSICGSSSISKSSASTLCGTMPISASSATTVPTGTPRKVATA